MQRRAFLLAGLGAVAFPASIEARRRGDGYTTIPYRPIDCDPYFQPGLELLRNRHLLDTEIRATVLRINESGWMWTAESCQGGHAWSKAPMLRLVCREADAGAMLAQLLSSVKVSQTELRIGKHAPVRLPGWFEVRVYARHRHGTRREGLAVFASFAEAVNR